MKQITWIALVSLLQLSTVNAASFDCAKAQSKVEHLICDNQEISRLDEDLSKAYSLAQGWSADKQTATKEQRQWLKEVRNACSDINCLKVAYAARISKLSITGASQNTARMTAKHIMPKTKEMDEFESFVKDKEYLDEPYEIASPEAEKLLQFIERKLSNGTQPLETWAKITLDNIKSGDGEYLKISDDVYLVKSGSVIRIADLRNQRLADLVSGGDLNVLEGGFLADGSGWLLVSYGGLSGGISSRGFHLIAFFDGGQSPYVVSASSVAEEIGYSEDEPSVGSYDYWCGPKENRIKGMAGRIEGHEWNDVNNDGQSELIFTVEEKNCQQVEKASIKRRLVFAVSKGKAYELR